MECLHPIAKRGDIHTCLMDWQVKNDWLAKVGLSKLEKNYNQNEPPTR